MPEIQGSATIHVEETDSAARVHVSAPKRLSRKSIFLMLFTALLVNAAIVLVALPKMSADLAPNYNTGFGDLYDLIAKNLDQGNGYRVDPAMGNTMIREPIYPFFLAAVFKLGGYGIQQGRAASVLLAFGTALILMTLTRKITGDTMTALAAALLFLLYPVTLVAEAHAGIEIPYAFAVVLFILVLYLAMEKGSLLRFWTAGLALGVAVMVRSQILLFAPLLLVVLLVIARGWLERRKVVARFAVLTLGAGVVMSPWIIRNYVLVHQFVPSATVAGIAAQEGLYTCENAASEESFSLRQTRAGFERAEFATRLGKPFIGPYYQLFYTPQDEIAFNQALLRYVSTEYRSHPELLAKCAAKNLFFNFWFLGKTPRSILLNVVIQAPLIGLALGGVALLWKRGLLGKAGIVLLYILYIPVIQSPIIAHARHSMLIFPFLAILAAVCLLSAWRALRMRNSWLLFKTVAATSGE
jgi:4-amino-4-deoxy-L-arabinose transferase-like glycosyltransferase